MAERLVEIGPFAGHSFETTRYVSCDLCMETACADLWADLTRHVPEAEWRQFYRALDDGEIVVCSNCLKGYMREGDS